MIDLAREIEDKGFATIDPGLDPDLVELLIGAITDLHLNPDRAGIRNLLDRSLLSQLIVA
jgi:hypothetical protein